MAPSHIALADMFAVFEPRKAGEGLAVDDVAGVADVFDKPVEVCKSSGVWPVR
ncbi:MAG: hypothetical protein AAFX99_29375 [Myxococcota bacterium]